MKVVDKQKALSGGASVKLNCQGSVLKRMNLCQTQHKSRKVMM